MTPLFYCYKCFAPVSAGADRCPGCGVAVLREPPKVYTALFAGMLAATAVAGGWAWVVNELWEKWQQRFDRLPEDHPLFRSETPAAWGVGVGLFLGTWVFALFVIRAARRG